MAVPGRLVVWINAFIPRDVPGYTIAIKRGENAGKTAIPLPIAARIPFPITNNLVKPPHTGYLTDQRSFSSNANASVRMQSHITISLPGGQVSGIHQTSGTTEVNTESGETRDNQDADMSDCQHSSSYAVPYALAQSLYEKRNSFSVGQLNNFTLMLKGPIRHRAGPWGGTNPESKYALMVNVKGAASDPCVRHAANIDYDVSFVVGVNQETQSMIVACLGFIDDFPAYEVYAKYLGETKTLCNVPPPPGNTVVNLLGDASRSLTCAAMFGPQVCTAPIVDQPNVLDLFQLR